MICIKPFTSFIIRVQINHLCKIKFILFESVLHFCYHFLLHVLYFSHHFSFKIQSESLLQLQIIKTQSLRSVYLYLLNLLSIYNVNGIVRKSAWQKYGESVLFQAQV